MIRDWISAGHVELKYWYSFAMSLHITNIRYSKLKIIMHLHMHLHFCMLKMMREVKQNLVESWLLSHGDN